jgi:acetolactate synthase I/II/III large subunit
MGCCGIRVETPEKIIEALDEASAAERPVVIDVLTDGECEAPALWPPS